MEDFIVTENGATCWHYDRTPFTREIEEKALKELSEKPEEREAAIQEFLQMITENSDFKSRLDYPFLLRFLRARKYDQTRAFQLLRNYYCAIKKYPVIFEDARPSVIEDKIMQFSSTVLPYRDPEGSVIIVIKASEWVPDRTTFHIALRIVIMTIETLIDDPVTQVAGGVVIIDFRNTGMKYLLHTPTPTNCYVMFNLLQNCFSGRMKTVHIVGESSIMTAAYNIAALFLKKKIKRRVIFHGDNMSSLHECIPPEILPEEYGGTLQVDNTLWAKKLLSMEETFLESLTYGFV